MSKGMLQGLAAMRQRQNEIGEAIASSEEYVSKLFLKDGDTAKVRFITDFTTDVVSGNFHIMPQIGKSGRQYWKTFPCTKEDGQCGWCEEGNSPGFRFGAWVWVHYILHSKRVTDDDEAILVGDKTMYRETVDAPMLFVQGWRVSCTLVAFHDKRGSLNDRDYDVTRVGKGLNTLYTFDPDDPSAFDKEIPELPPIWDAMIDEVGGKTEETKKEKTVKAQKKVVEAQDKAVSNVADVNALLAQLNVDLFDDNGD